jgi:hypothetical protein
MKLLIVSLVSIFLLIGNLYAFDHKHFALDGLLKKHVSNGRVNYSGLLSDSKSLDMYLSSLSAVSQTEYNGFSKTQKIAFLINAYNAFTIKLILDNYPVKSIKKIGGLFTSPWKIQFFELLGSKRHLDWIEHSKLRIDFDEPRIHFSIVCASIGCPPLANTAFTPENLEAQLQSLLENFLRDKAKNRYDERKKILYLSPIFKWFQKDFTKNGTVIDYVKRYIGNTISEDTKIEYTNYDWNLNER